MCLFNPSPCPLSDRRLFHIQSAEHVVLLLVLQQRSFRTWNK